MAPSIDDRHFSAQLHDFADHAHDAVLEGG
jgi:hypothetical protein